MLALRLTRRLSTTVPVRPPRPRTFPPLTPPHPHPSLHRLGGPTRLWPGRGWRAARQRCWPPAAPSRRSPPTSSTPASTSGWRRSRPPKSASRTSPRRSLGMSSSLTCPRWAPAQPRSLPARAGQPRRRCALTRHAGRWARASTKARPLPPLRVLRSSPHPSRHHPFHTNGDGLSRMALPCAQSSNDIYAPCGGTVVAVNEALEDEPELLNASAHGDGWIAEFEARPTPLPPSLAPSTPRTTAQLRAHRLCLLTPVAGLRAAGGHV